MSLDYAQDQDNYDHLVGSVLRGFNYEILGTVISIEYAIDRWRHHNAMAVLDNGRRISCRALAKI
jgi:hypothetical protein